MQQFYYENNGLQVTRSITARMAAWRNFHRRNVIRKLKCKAFFLSSFCRLCLMCFWNFYKPIARVLLTETLSEVRSDSELSHGMAWRVCRVITRRPPTIRSIRCRITYLVIGGISGGTWGGRVYWRQRRYRRRDFRCALPDRRRRRLGMPMPVGHRYQGTCRLIESWKTRNFPVTIRSLSLKLQ